MLLILEYILIIDGDEVSGITLETIQEKLKN